MEDIRYQNMTHTLGPGVQVRYEETSEVAKGWVCPKCGRAIQPQYKSCPYCDGQMTDEGLAPGERIITG